MKKLFQLFYFSIIFFSIVSCASSDDDPTQQPPIQETQEIPSNLHGKWKIIYVNDIDVINNDYSLGFSPNRIVSDYTGSGGKTYYSVSAIYQMGIIKSNTGRILIEEKPSLKYIGCTEFKVQITSLALSKSYIDIITAKKL